MVALGLKLRLNELIFSTCWPYSYVFGEESHEIWLIHFCSYRGDEDLRDRRKEKFEKDPSDLRHNLSRRRQSDGDEIRVDIRYKRFDMHGYHTITSPLGGVEVIPYV